MGSLVRPWATLESRPDYDLGQWDPLYSTARYFRRGIPIFRLCVDEDRMESVNWDSPWILYVITTSPFYLGKLRFYVNYDKLYGQFGWNWA